MSHSSELMIYLVACEKILWLAGDFGFGCLVAWFEAHGAAQNQEHAVWLPPQNSLVTSYLVW